MKRLSALLISLVLFGNIQAAGQKLSDTTFYLITCAPGTETYSVWGHSALRVAIANSSDLVYNWGVFDFNTPNFAWKFARGRLNYMLGVYPYDRFLRDYFLSSRSVWSQQLNLEPVEKLRMMILLEENLKPENRYYRYDFFYDDCSTRIRDLIEKVLAGKLIYPPDDISSLPTFRDRIGKYLVKYPWLDFGVDLLMGRAGERKASFRDRMFLPDDLMGNLSQVVVNRDRKMVPLLQNAGTVLEFPEPTGRNSFFTGPVFVFSLVFLVVLLLSVVMMKSKVMHFIDTGLFLLFSILSLMMIFFSFFSDHQQMKLNLNLIWLNPVIPVALFYIVFGKSGRIWFRIIFAASAVFVLLLLIMPDAFNTSFLPLTLILLLRSSARSDFSWNPFSV